MNEDQQAVKKLDKIIDDKKPYGIIDNKIIDVDIKITELDKILFENAINNLEEVVMREKG